MGVIQLISSLEIFKDLNHAIHSIWGSTSSEIYPGFTPAWYMNTGLSICLFLFTSSFISSFNKIKTYMKAEFKRFIDRTYKPSQLKRDPDEPNDDEPNTRMRL